MDGYTVVYDKDIGRYAYATLVNGEFVSTGVSQDSSPPAYIRRHLRESEVVRNSKFRARQTRMNPQNDVFEDAHTFRTLGQNKGLLNGRRVSEGKVRGLTVLVHFTDIKSSVTAADMSAMLSGTSYRENGNLCSVREYYQMMSSGKLDYTNVVVGPITLSHDRKYYTRVLMVEEVLQNVKSMGIDLSQFDMKREGYIDALNILYAGVTLYEGELWPHNGVANVMVGQYRAYFYMLSSMGYTKADLSIGIFCHENGHMLCRFPDLSDYGTRDGDSEESAGLGIYCLMSAGNHNNYGRTPSAICAYLRYLVG